MEKRKRRKRTFVRKQIHVKPLTLMQMFRFKKPVPKAKLATYAIKIRNKSSEKRISCYEMKSNGSICSFHDEKGIAVFIVAKSQVEYIHRESSSIEERDKQRAEREFTDAIENVYRDNSGLFSATNLHNKASLMLIDMLKKEGIFYFVGGRPDCLSVHYSKDKQRLERQQILVLEEARVDALKYAAVMFSEVQYLDTVDGLEEYIDKKGYSYKLVYTTEGHNGKQASLYMSGSGRGWCYEDFEGEFCRAGKYCEENDNDVDITCEQFIQLI